jgi:predicted transposase/invertase (TIGR01784 family)
MLTLTLDYTFKKVFAEHYKILIHLVNSLMNFAKGQWIDCIQVLNPKILPEDITQKFIVLDILAYDNFDRRFNIEMQAKKFDYYQDRAAYYLSRLFSKQLERGDEYGYVSTALGIHILNYVQYPDIADFHYEFLFRDTNHHEIILSENIALHMFELPKINPEYRNQSDRNQWLYFIKNAHKEKEKDIMTNYSIPEIHQAYQILKQLSQDEEAKLHAEARQMALMTERISLRNAKNEGRNEGENEGKKIVAKNLIQAGMPFEQVAIITELDIHSLYKLTK